MKSYSVVINVMSDFLLQLIFRYKKILKDNSPNINKITRIVIC